MRTHRIKHFLIIKCGEGYIIHNTRYAFKEAHTHIKNLGYCKRIIYNILYNRRPETKNIYLLDSHIRVSDSETYKDMIRDLKASRSDPKPHYININKGVRR